MADRANISVDDAQWQRAKQKALSLRMPLSAVIRELLRLWLSGKVDVKRANGAEVKR